MQLVSINKKIKGGIPVVHGTRIPVKNIAFLNYKKNISAGRIAGEYYTQLSLDLVNDVLAWFKKNRSKYVGLDF